MNLTATCRRRFKRGGCYLFVVILLVQVGIISAQNVASNPGFETGSTTGWSGFGSPTISAQTAQVHSGTYAGLVANRTATYMGMAHALQTVFQTNQLYTISVWVRLVSGANQTIQLTMQKVDGSVTSYAFVASGSVSSTGWSQLIGTYTLNYTNTLASLTLYAEMPTSATASYYIDDLQVVPPPPPSTSGQCSVDWSMVFQRIDGFGASSAWQSTWTVAQGDMFFSTNSGTGVSKNGTNFAFNGVALSLLRTRIAPGATTVENGMMQLAQARGAKVWSTPWSPAANFKSNGNVNGGAMVGNAANYQAYANQLAGYVVNMKSTYGINLAALSVQNEPDAQVTTYESCNWTAQQIHDFVPYLYNSLAASNVAATKIILPESENWGDPSNLVATAMSDSTSNLVGIIADHNYDGANGPGSLVKNSHGKALWETEVSLLSGSDSSITNGVYYASRIHLFLTEGQVNAWHYWWLMPGNSTGNQGLTDTNGVPAKRMYALGNFSRFVRPNFYRINIATNSGTALISAYKDSLSANFAIVAVNTGPTDIAQIFNFTNVTGVSNVVPWLTTSNLNLASQAAVTVSNGSFAYTLPAMSVVTFAGQAAPNTPPMLAAISDQIVNPGFALAVTNLATDADTPGQSLTFTLLNGPSNATLNPANGIFRWRPLLSQANSTNAIVTRVTDGGTPNLSATNSFSVKVNPATSPGLATVSFTNGWMTLSVTGQAGPDYTLLKSTNLIDWQALFTTNPAVLPVVLVDTNTTSMPAQFYRLQLGP